MYIIIVTYKVNTNIIIIVILKTNTSIISKPQNLQKIILITISLIILNMHYI